MTSQGPSIKYRGNDGTRRYFKCSIARLAVVFGIVFQINFFNSSIDSLHLKRSRYKRSNFSNLESYPTL